VALSQYTIDHAYISVGFEYRTFPNLRLRAFQLDSRCTPHQQGTSFLSDNRRANEIHRYLDGRGVAADRRGCSFAPDRIEVVERIYEGEFDDPKTDAGRRSIPLNSFGILRGVLEAAWQQSRRRNPGELVFTNARRCRPQATIDRLSRRDS
jgi:hypothetical protein